MHVKQILFIWFMLWAPQLFSQPVALSKLPPQGVVNTIERANIIIALDTSGSMQGTLGPGRSGCGSNERMWIAAQTINNLVNSFRNVADFGLIRWNSGFSSNDDFRSPFALVPISITSNQRILDITSRYMNRCTATAPELLSSGGTNVDTSAMRNVTNYISSNPSLFTGSCKRTLVLLISDGAWGSASRTQNAANMAASLRSTYGVTTTTIGISTDGTLAQYQAVSTAGGGGDALFASDQITLQNGIQAKLTTFLADAFTATAPAVMPSLTEGSLIYQPTFEYRREGQWKGLLKAYRLDVSGSSASLVWEAGQKLMSVDPATRNLWTVGGGLIAGGSGGYRNFTEANVSTLRRMLNPAWTSPLNDPVARTLIRFVQGYDVYNEESEPMDRRWMLGDIYNSKPIYIGPPQDMNKDDPDKVGVTGFFEQIASGAFTRYVNTWAGRQPILLAASNTGVLHAFDPSVSTSGGGRELWGFIPPPILDKLIQMTGSGRSQARYMIDGSITARDVFVNGQWRTYVAFTYGQGARALTVMDVTNTLAPTHVFSIENYMVGTNSQIRYWDANGNLSYPRMSDPFFSQFSELGFSRSTPIFTFAKNINDSYASVLVVGGGYANPTNLVSINSILKPQTGNVGYVINLDGPSLDPAGTNSRKPGAIMRALNAHNPALTYSGCPNCSIPYNQLINDFEVIESGQTSRMKKRYGFQLFMPNYSGAVQSVDLSGLSAGYSISPTPLEMPNFAPGNSVTQVNDRMLTVPISISTLTHRKIDGELNLTFGTGDMTNLSLSGKQIDNRVYSLQDSETAIMAGSSFNDGNLFNIPGMGTSACPMPSGRKGWFLSLNSMTAKDESNVTYSLRNGKVASKILQYGGSTIVPVYVPRNDGQCSIGNSAVLLRDTACGFDKQSQVFANSMIGGVTVLGETLVIGISGNAGTRQLGNFRKTDNLIIGKGTFDSTGSGSVNIYNKLRVR